MAPRQAQEDDEREENEEADGAVGPIERLTELLGISGRGIWVSGIRVSGIRNVLAIHVSRAVTFFDKKY